jgi:hypothetical protein
MAIEKLTEFAKTGQKNTDDLDLETGFIVNRKPARQWFNWLFSTLTTKINEIIDADFMPKSDVVDNLTTNDTTKPVSAKQAKLLQDNKLDKTANAVSATKLQTARTIGGVSFDGTANINLPGVNAAGNQNTTGNAATATKLAIARKIAGVSFDGTADINLPIFSDGANVTASRLSGVTYTNANDRPMFVFMSLMDTDGANFVIKIGALTYTSPYDLPQTGYLPVCFIVPPRKTYSVKWAPASYPAGLNFWWEF